MAELWRLAWLAACSVHVSIFQQVASSFTEAYMLVMFKSFQYKPGSTIWYKCQAATVIFLNQKNQTIWVTAKAKEQPGVLEKISLLDLKKSVDNQKENKEQPELMYFTKIIWTITLCHQCLLVACLVGCLLCSFLLRVIAFNILLWNKTLNEIKFKFQPHNRVRFLKTFLIEIFLPQLGDECILFLMSEQISSRKSGTQRHHIHDVIYD